MNAIINIIKPTGVSSNKILNIIKNKYKGMKVGHFGTLDPMACGVLPVAIGKATRLFDYFLKKDKEYIAAIHFGKNTDTLDSEGVITETSLTIPTISELKLCLNKFIGEIQQLPPQYSALKVNGVCAYELARKGVEVELRTRAVTIYNLEVLIQISYDTYLLKINCSSGTYIRSLIRDIANALNTVAYMPQLIRTKAGCFNIQNAYTIEEIENNQAKLNSIDEVVNLEKLILPEKYYNLLCNGVKVVYNEIEQKTNDFLLYCKNELFGIANINKGYVNIKTNLRG